MITFFYLRKEETTRNTITEAYLKFLLAAGILNFKANLCWQRLLTLLKNIVLRILGASKERMLLYDETVFLQKVLYKIDIEKTIIAHTFFNRESYYSMLISGTQDFPLSCQCLPVHVFVMFNHHGSLCSSFYAFITKTAKFFS